jgi:ribosomal protein S18 acetylase RimI-like enzyme
VVTRGKIHRPEELEGFVALTGGDRAGLLTYRLEGGACEIVTIDAVRTRRGVGTALLEHLVKSMEKDGVEKVWLVTTNDNLPAQRFYERRGFALAKVHRGALSESRKLKPEIPLTGIDGLPIEDEFEYEKWL